MRLAVPATGKTLDSDLARHFGQCSYFVIVDPETFDCESVQNFTERPKNRADIKAAEVLSKSGVDSVATVNITPKAFNALADAEINIFTGASGTVQEVVEEYNDGKLRQMNKSATSTKGEN